MSKKSVDTIVDEDAAKEAALEAFLSSMKKERPGEVVLLNDNASGANIDTVSTGILALDAAIGGGVPYARITELYGPEGGGKSSLALAAAVQCQQAGGIIGWIDAEHGLNRDLCRNIGIDESRMVVAQPDSGEDAIEIVVKMIESGAFSMIVVDSVAAMTPRDELNSDIDQKFMGLHARLMSTFMRRVAALVSNSKVALVLVNQIRSNLQQYGAPEQSTGGKAIKFYASLRLEVRGNIGGKKIQRGSDIIGQEVDVTVKKNRLGAPGRKATFDLIFGQGFDASGSLLDVCEQLGIIDRPKGSATYTSNLTGERIGVGKEKVKALLASEDGAELAEELTAAVKAALSGEDVFATDGTEATDDFEDTDGDFEEAEALVA